jgi:hypothetical protein
MSDVLILDGRIDEQGRLIVDIPPDAPQGEVEVIIKKRIPHVEPELTPEEEAALKAELEELLKPENLRGKGLTAGEIIKSPAIGIWKDREETQDSVAWVSETRRKRRERQLKGD